ncbi:hypothetical protein [Rhizorhabdus dicambivorans]|nr:hypothetical protein [Rhizorhabdus dicambivorans]
MQKDGKWKGEGNYEAARQYDEGATAHARDKDKVKTEAEAAKTAVDGPEGDELRAAEKEGRSHARS